MSIGALGFLDPATSQKDTLAYHIPGFLENFQADEKNLRDYIKNMQYAPEELTT